MVNSLNTAIDFALPYSSEAERSVLGAIILDNSVIDRIAEWLSPDDFYQESHRILYAKMLQMASAQTVIDLVTLKNNLDANQIGGIGYIFGLADAVPSARNVEHYARIVMADSQRRRLIQVAYDAIDAARDRDSDPKEIRAQMETALFPEEKNICVKSFAEVAKEADAIFQQQEKSNGEPTGIETGLTDLDLLLDGFQPEDLIILAGRPSMGKTACACSITEHISETKKVCVFSAEQNRNQWFNRMIAKKASVNAFGLRSGRHSSWRKVYSTNMTLGLRQSWIDDTPAVSLSHIRSVSKQIWKESGLDLIVIDYLGLIKHHAPKNVTYKRSEVVGEISHGLKALARELKVPVLCLCQLNREVEETQAPSLSNLRESGDIEQDADVVLFLWKKLERPKDKGTKGRTCDMITVAKHRNGPTGAVEVIFKREYAAFYSATQQEAVE